jgi:hypothetical protein
MGLNNIMGILNQYRDVSAAMPPPNVEQDYSQVAQSAPQSHLASGLAEAFRSNDTPPSVRCCAHYSATRKVSNAPEF